jgi:hypothetical protein
VFPPPRLEGGVSVIAPWLIEEPTHLQVTDNDWVLRLVCKSKKVEPVLDLLFE